MTPRHARAPGSGHPVLPVALAVLALASAVLALQLNRASASPSPSAPQRSATSPVLTARRVPQLLAAPVADARLASQLDALVAASRGPSCLTVDAGGRPVYSHDATSPFTPASLEKLLTGAAALQVLGPDTTLSTQLVAAGAPQHGVVAGDLWFVGGGDPLLMSAPFVAHLKHPPPERTELDKVADALVAAGVTHIAGGVVGDESRYDQQRYEPTWPTRFATLAESGPLSALNVDDGLDQFPTTPDVHVPLEHPAPDPAAHAASLLVDVLKARGITVDGGASSGAAPSGAMVVASVASAPVSGLVAEMLRESDNETAELLTKEMGRKAGGGGTTVEGVQVITATLQQMGLPLDGSVRVDGSGLSDHDKVTCALIDKVLTGTGPTGTMGAALPVAGQTGTLEKRFVGAPVAGRLRAKTGTLNQATALAGFLPTAHGAAVQLTYIMNLDPAKIVNNDDLRVQDQLAAILDTYPSGPDLATLGPLP